MHNHSDASYATDLGVLEILSGITVPNISRLMRIFSEADGYSVDGGIVMTQPPAIHVTGRYDSTFAALQDISHNTIVTRIISERAVLEGRFCGDGSFVFFDTNGTQHTLRFFCVRPLPAAHPQAHEPVRILDEEKGGFGVAV